MEHCIEGETKVARNSCHREIQAWTDRQHDAWHGGMDRTGCTGGWTDSTGRDSQDNKLGMWGQVDQALSEMDGWVDGRIDRQCGGQLAGMDG